MVSRSRPPGSPGPRLAAPAYAQLAIVAATLVAGCPAPPTPTGSLDDPSAAGPKTREQTRLPSSQRKAKVRKEKKELSGADPELPVVLGRPMSAIYFEHYGVSPTIDTEEESVSSFGLDVDTASYALARALLEQDEIPDEASVRVEEFINYFDYAYASPADADFALHAEVVPSSKRPGYHVLHLGVRARDLEIGDRDPANLVFLIDASGSMAKGERMPLVRDSLRLLVETLDERDWISIVSYADDARVMLEPTPGHERERILDGIEALRAEGSTNVAAGLRVAYELASRSPLGALYGPSAPGLPTPPGLRPHADRVLLCSDGLANLEAIEAEMLLATVADKARRGISISTIGVGMGSYHDPFLEEIAMRGHGRYAYVDRLSDAKRVFVENLTGTLQIVGLDAKIQVEFDPSTVARYRLVGYESQAMGADSLVDDRGDDGEIGAGHSATAIYEIQLRDSVLDALADGDAVTPLEHLSLGTVRLRYRKPGETLTTIHRLEEHLPVASIHLDAADAPPATQLAIVVAAFAEKLRGSYWIRTTSWQTIIDLYEALPAELQQKPEVIELGNLIRKAARTDQRAPRTDLEATVTRVDFDRVPVLR